MFNTGHTTRLRGLEAVRRSIAARSRAVNGWSGPQTVPSARGPAHGGPLLAFGPLCSTERLRLAAGRSCRYECSTVAEGPTCAAARPLEISEPLRRLRKSPSPRRSIRRPPSIGGGPDRLPLQDRSSEEREFGSPAGENGNRANPTFHPVCASPEAPGRTTRSTHPVRPSPARPPHTRPAPPEG